MAEALETLLVYVWKKIKKLVYFTIELIFNTIYGHIELFELFMGLTVLFQLTFIFIYSIFSKKFSISVK